MKISQVLGIVDSLSGALPDRTDTVMGILPLIDNPDSLSVGIRNGLDFVTGSLTFNKRDIRRSFLPNRILKLFRVKNLEVSLVPENHSLEILRAGKRINIRVPLNLTKSEIAVFIFDYVSNIRLGWLSSLILAASEIFLPNMSKLDESYDREMQLKIYITLGILKIFRFSGSNNVK